MLALEPLITYWWLIIDCIFWTVLRFQVIFILFVGCRHGYSTIFIIISLKRNKMLLKILKTISSRLWFFHKLAFINFLTHLFLWGKMFQTHTETWGVFFTSIIMAPLDVNCLTRQLSRKQLTASEIHRLLKRLLLWLGAEVANLQSQRHPWTPPSEAAQRGFSPVSLVSLNFFLHMNVVFCGLCNFLHMNLRTEGRRMMKNQGLMMEWAVSNRRAPRSA